MTAVIILLSLVIGVAVVLAMEWTQLFSRDPRVGDLPRLAARFSDSEAYRPVERLFSDADARFLRGRGATGAELEKKLRHNRARAMRSYMTLFRRDFHEAWGVARFLAPFNDDPSFGVALVKQLLTFYRLYGAVQVQMLIYAYKPASVDLGDLVNALQKVRETALQTLASTENMAVQASAA